MLRFARGLSWVSCLMLLALTAQALRGDEVKKDDKEAKPATLVIKCPDDSDFQKPITIEIGRNPARRSVQKSWPLRSDVNGRLSGVR